MMYKVLLVDDERQVRNGLKAKLQWEQLGFELCGEAVNGQAALDEIDRLHPHLVISDIRMPVMNGIELLRRCAELYPEIRFIVLSGYDEFDYVKAALQCGARDYLLKPVIRKELANRLKQIKLELDEHHQRFAKEQEIRRVLEYSRQKLLEQFWLQAVRGSNRSKDWEEEAERCGLTDLLEAHTKVRFVTVEIKDIRNGMPGSIPDALLWLAAYLMTGELLQLWGEEAYVFRDTAEPPLIYIAARCDMFGDETLAHWLRTEYEPQLQTMLKVRAQIGIGDTVSGPNEWRKGYLSSRVHWMQQSPAGVPDTKADQQQMEWFDLLPMTEKQLTSAIMECDLHAFGQALHSVLRSEVPLSYQALSVRVLRLLLFIDALAAKVGMRLEEAHHLISGLPESLWAYHTTDKAEELLAALAKRIMDDMEREQRSGGQEAVRQVVAYLQEHYADEDLTLTRMARQFHLNVTYLSELFKKMTGQNYSDYLTGLRVKKAKELLSAPLLRISDVAELVGFANPNYFSQVFKKITGQSPGEYRQQRSAPKAEKIIE
ncbi:response regulator [Paenibacillus tarimensis]